MCRLIQISFLSCLVQLVSIPNQYVMFKDVLTTKSTAALRHTNKASSDTLLIHFNVWRLILCCFMLWFVSAITLSLKGLFLDKFIRVPHMPQTFQTFYHDVHL